MDELAKIKSIKKDKQSRAYVTGLHNTPAGMKAAELLLQHTNKTSHPALFALIVFPDIERLLSLGSFAALKEAWPVMEKRLRRYLPSNSLCTQTQFGLLIQVWDRKAVQKLASAELESMLEYLNRPFNLGHSSNIGSFSLRSYAGYLLLPDDKIPKGNAESLISKLAIAAQSSRHSEKRLKQFSPALQKLLARQENIIRELPVAVQEQQFDLSFEPQFSARKKSLCGAQTRINWHNDHHGNVTGAELTNAFALTGTLPEVVKFSLGRSTSFLRSLKARGDLPYDFKLSISIPFEIFHYKNFILSDELEKFIYQSKVNVANLGIEIEGNMEFNSAQYANAHNQLKAIKKLNIPVGLNSTTNLTVLMLLSTGFISFLKWSLEKTEHISSGTKIKLLGSAVALAKQNQTNILVEGIELSSQLKILCLNELETLQGPLFSKPLSEPGFHSYLKYSAMLERQQSMTIPDDADTPAPKPLAGGA